MCNRWDDDVVFKNQARGTENKGKSKEFINVSCSSSGWLLCLSRYNDANVTRCRIFCALISTSDS